MSATNQYMKTTQALNYIAESMDNDVANKLMAIKLLWAADRYHLRKYGRPISSGDYLAMKLGPVNSTAKDIAEENDFIPEELLEYSKQYIRQKTKHFYISKRPTDKSKLSDSDIEALEFAIKRFGHIDKFEFSKFTHNYPEWSKFKDVLFSNTSIREEMSLDDFFKNTNLIDDPFELSEEQLRTSKEIFKENQQVESIFK